MKIRNGFVSNSSSSSFCLVGAYDRNGTLINDLMERNKTQSSEIGEGRVYLDSVLELCELEEITELEDGTAVVSGGCIGIPFGGDPNVTINQVKQEFLDYLKSEYNITLPERDVCFQYGESQG